MNADRLGSCARRAACLLEWCTAACLVVPGLLAISGCLAPDAQEDRDRVSLGLETRIGHSLGTVHAPAPRVEIPEEIADLDDGLDEREAVAIALWNNPTFQAALADLSVSRADLIQAGLLSNPIFSTFLPLGPKQLEFAITWPLDAIWLRSHRVRIADLDYKRVGEQLIATGLDLSLATRIAFTDLVWTSERSRLSEDSVEISRQLSEIAESRLAAGAASELERTAARVEEQRAIRDAMNARREEELARKRLQGLLGLARDDVPLELATPLPSLEFTRIDELEDEDALLGHADAARPDLRAQELAAERACERVGLAQWDILRLSVILDANARGTKGFEMGPGMALTVPLFDHNQGLVARIEAELAREVFLYAALRERIALEIAEARIRLLQARTELELLESGLLKSLQEQGDLTERAFRGGIVPFSEVLLARRGLLTEQLREVDLRADLSRAWARLERSVGGRLTHAPRGAQASLHANEDDTNETTEARS